MNLAVAKWQSKVWVHVCAKAPQSNDRLLEPHALTVRRPAAAPANQGLLVSLSRRLAFVAGASWGSATRSMASRTLRPRSTWRNDPEHAASAQLIHREAGSLLVPTLMLAEASSVVRKRSGLAPRLRSSVQLDVASSGSSR